MDEATKQALLSAVRSLLIVAGGGLATHGVIKEGNVNIIVGALMAIIPIVWGVIDKFMAERLTKAREAVAVNVGIAVADSTPGPTPLVTAIDAPQLIKSVAPTLSAGPIDLPAEPSTTKEIT